MNKIIVWSMLKIIFNMSKLNNRERKLSWRYSRSKLKSEHCQKIIWIRLSWSFIKELKLRTWNRPKTFTKKITSPSFLVPSEKPSYCAHEDIQEVINTPKPVRRKYLHLYHYCQVINQLIVLSAKRHSWIKPSWRIMKRFKK